MNKKKEKKPIEIIREMNPETWLPSGEELAEMLREKYGTTEGEKEGKS